MPVQIHMYMSHMTMTCTCTCIFMYVYIHIHVHVHAYMYYYCHLACTLYNYRISSNIAEQRQKITEKYFLKPGLKPATLC